MKAGERIRTVYEILDGQLPKEIQFLDERDPFRFLISVILSAQTTDRIVNVVVRDLFAAYPDAESLAAARLEDVEAIIYATGFYRAKAKNIIATARQLAGRPVPSTMEELIALPGVGRKTASCVLGDIYGKPAIIVDTHFSRVVNRLSLVDTKDPVKVEEGIKEILDPSMQYRFSMTANLWGRTVCHAKRPLCEECAIAALCPSRDGFLERYANERGRRPSRP
ncbi:MAG TPA: endonuclease III [Sphaerochaeta sp.]|nr:endonuclease III [Sphaerochaeta sp.]